MLFHTSKTQDKKGAISYSLMKRAGYIKQIAAGLYQYSPLMVRVLRKIENIVRMEMDSIGCTEVDLSQMHPDSIWNESGRFCEYKKDGAMLTTESRDGKLFCLAPTAEESALKLIEGWAGSYKNLPLSIYQINNKFRDEIRPKNGLMRTKMFSMKDAYSFSSSKDSAKEEYEKMRSAYIKIMDRIGIDGVFVGADSGSMGGNHSEEFQAFVKNMGDLIIISDSGLGYNIEAARSKIECDDSSEFELHFYKSKELKKTVVAIHLRGREINQFKIEKCIGCSLEKFSPKYVDFKEALFLADESLKKINARKIIDNICDLKLFNFETDSMNEDELKFADLDLSCIGDKCNDFEGSFVSKNKSIEVGHIFILDDKYSKSMNITYKNSDGEHVPYIMGCYGIGISRLAAVYVEQNNDSKGIIWSKKISPYIANIISTRELERVGDSIYEKLISMGIDALIDDRDGVSFGSKIKDSDLIGIPYKIIVGKKYASTGMIEVEDREGVNFTLDNIEKVASFINENMN